MFRLLTSVPASEHFKRQLPVFLVAWSVLHGALLLLIGPRSPERFQP
jgi:hypothetical protein